MKYTTHLFLTLFTLSATYSAALGGPLMDAVESGNIKRVKELIKKGADVNERRKKNGEHSPLGLAAQSGNTVIAKLLLNNGADVDDAKLHKKGYKIFPTYTPLHRAAGNGNLEMCKLLLAYRAKVDHNKYIDWSWTGTALAEAAHNNHLEVCKLLILHGADVMAKYEWGEDYTALNAFRGQALTEIIKFLIENEYNTNIVMPEYNYLLAHCNNAALAKQLRDKIPTWQLQENHANALVEYLKQKFLV